MMRFATLLFIGLSLLRVAAASTYAARLGHSGAHTHAPHTYQHTNLVGASTGQMALGAVAGQTPVPGLSVYPNPARGQTTVQVSGPGGADYKLRLSNVLGSEVRRLLVRPDNQATEGFALDVSDLPPGLYFCSLLVNDKTLVTKRLTVL